MLDQGVAADVFGLGQAPYVQQLLAGVHDAQVAADDHAEREQQEQHADVHGRQLQPVESLGRGLAEERVVVEVQPELDHHVMRPGRLQRHGLRGRGRVLLLEHADPESRVVHVLGDLLQLSCDTHPLA